MCVCVCLCCDKADAAKEWRARCMCDARQTIALARQWRVRQMLVICQERPVAAVGGQLTRSENVFKLC